MILHLVAFSFKESASEADRQAIIAELAELPDHYPTMQRFAIGPNISQRDETFSHAFSVEFESEAELVAYLDSERHETFVSERFRPMIERRIIVSLEA